MNITIGADPELFLKDKSSNFISSIDKFGGTKEDPKPIGAGCFVQEDNVAVEFNIPAHNTVEKFIESINYSLTAIKTKAEEYNLDLAIVPAAYFSRDELVDPRAKEFGCEPDKNAWTLKTNPRPQAVNPTLRSAGGHVHVGCTAFCNDNLLSNYEVIRAMDLYLGVPSVGVDKDIARRQLYGRAGAYREKNYGVEYRTLSNFWIIDSQKMRWVFEQTHKALEWLGMGNRLSDKDGVEIQKCINLSDAILMNAIMRRYGLEAISS